MIKRALLVVGFLALCFPVAAQQDNRTDEFGTYIEGGVGNDKFQINAGASYQKWNGRAPRLRH